MLNTKVCKGEGDWPSWLPLIKLLLFSQHVSGGSHGPRGMRINSYDPDETPGEQQGKSTLGAQVNNQRKPASQRVATISNQHNEKTMLLSSDDEFQWLLYYKENILAT